MRRRASVLFLGLFAVSAGLQGAAACSNSDATTPPGNDSGPPPSTDSSTTDTGNPLSQGCSGTVPVMTVTGPSGDQIAPDWSCYAQDAGFLVHPFDEAGTDADADDGSDASDSTTEDVTIPDTGIDAPVFDVTPPPDSAVPPDSAPPPDGGSGSYILALTDFLTGAPPTGATVDIYWGGSSLVSKAYTGTVDDAGLLAFPPPPAGQSLFSYHMSGNGESNLYWLSVVAVPPPGRATYNSLLTSSLKNLLTSVLGSQSPNANLATLVTGAQDCQARDVNGGQFTVIDTANGNAPVQTSTAPGQPRAAYLQNNFPNPLCTYSSNNGRAVWTMINAPVDTAGRYVLQFSGRMDSAHPVSVLAQYPIESYAGAVTVQRSGRLNASPPN